MNTSSKPFDNEDLICPICLDFPVNPPVTTPCGHVFCRECLDKALANRQCCPLDRRAVTQDQVKEVDKDGPIWKTWSEIEVRCRGHQIGCHWIGPAKDYAGHETGCVFEMIAKIQRKVLIRRNTNNESRAQTEDFLSFVDSQLRDLMSYRQMCEMDDALGENFRRANEEIETQMNVRRDIIAHLEKLDMLAANLLVLHATIEDMLLEHHAMRTLE